MVRGVTTGGQRGQGGAPGRCLRLAWLALFVLAGCGSAESADGGGSPDSWWGLGGQTGSLMPTCGLAPAAREQGVPASATGVVVYTSPCGALPQGELVLFDAQGRPVPAQTQPLGGGAVLVTPQAGLAPGSYVLGSAVAPEVDADGGLDDDADAGTASVGQSDAGAPTVRGEPLVVVAPSAPPTRLGELRQLGGACSTQIELVLDPGIEPYAASLALDLRVGGGALQRVVAFGTLDVSAAGTAEIAIPGDLLFERGPYAITLEAVLAGSSVAIEPATLQIECRDAAAGAMRYGESGCGLIGGRPRSSGSATWLLVAFGLFGWHRRRRRRRAPR